MRIRQIRPEFWTDEVMASLPYAARLFYVGLWNICDDAGYCEWRPTRIGAQLFPYESARHRERQIAAWADALVKAGRLVLYPDCGCARIPTLPRHQRIAGTRSYTARDAHDKHAVAPNGYEVLSRSPVEERRVEERRGIDDGLRKSYRKLGLPVDAP